MLRGFKKYLKHEIMAAGEGLHPHELESKRVLEAVSNLGRQHEAGHELPAVHLADFGATEHWTAFTSVFQETAFKGIYGDILEDLARIESKVVFDDRN